MYDVGVCVGCLATSVKMFSMRSRGLLEPYRLLTGIQLDDDMPEKLCWECAALVNKFCVFRHKCERAHRLLTDIYQRHGELSEEILESIDRSQYDLQSSYITKTDLRSIRLNSSKVDFDNENEYPCSQSGDSLKEDGQSQMCCENVGEMAAVKVEVDVDFDRDELGSEMKLETEVDQEIECDTVMDVIKNNMSKRVVKTEKQKKKKSVASQRCKLKIPACQFGMKEEYLTHEQQYDVIRERRSCKNYKSARYPCELCCRPFNEEAAFANHRRLHEPTSGRYECDICKTRYRSRVMVYRHISSSHARRYTCVVCNKAFYSRNRAQSHFDWHRGVTYNCEQCDAKFIKKTTLHSHIRKKHALHEVCRHCAEPFHSRRGLDRHVRLMHPSKDESGTTEAAAGPFCAACSIQFTCQQAWTRHVLISPTHTHERHLFPHGCDACGENFPDERSLSLHWDARTQCNPHQPRSCGECGEMLSGLRAHDRHLRAHHPQIEDDLPFRSLCETCGKVFNTRAHMKFHSARACEQYSCTTCGKSFKKKHLLKSHALTHSAEKPFVCTACGAGFAKFYNLERHQLVHTNEKPYCCESCGKTFKDLVRVRRHMQFVHSDKPWPRRERTKRGPRGTTDLT